MMSRSSISTRSLKKASPISKKSEASRNLLTKRPKPRWTKCWRGYRPIPHPFPPPEGEGDPPCTEPVIASKTKWKRGNLWDIPPCPLLCFSSPEGRNPSLHRLAEWNDSVAISGNIYPRGVLGFQLLSLKAHSKTPRTPRVFRKKTKTINYQLPPHLLHISPPCVHLINNI